MKARKVPKFAVVGQPNAGKSTVIATIAENDQIVVSPDPGATVQRQEFIYEVDFEELVGFIDTPGFQHPRSVAKWIREQALNHENPAEAFIEKWAGQKKFAHDSEIMAALAAGAVALYVVDTDRPPEEDDHCEAEILRLARVPRLGILNPRQGSGEYRKEWETLLKTELNNQFIDFDPFNAEPEDKLRLFLACQQLLCGKGGDIESAIDAIQGLYAERLQVTSEAVVVTLKEAVTTSIREEVRRADGMESQAEDRALTKLGKAIAKIESRFRKTTCDRFRHSTEPWIQPHALKLDPLKIETWELLGFTRKQVIVAASASGAAAGAATELAFGAPTLCIAGSLAGGAIGAAAAIYGGPTAVRTRNPFGLKNLLPTPIAGESTLGKAFHCYGVDPVRVPSVLLDRLILHAVLCARWPHGRRLSGSLLALPPEFTNNSRFTQSEEFSRFGVKTFQAIVEQWVKDRLKSHSKEGDLARCIEDYLNSSRTPKCI